MYTVTLPNGRTYTYGPNRYAAAAALARKANGTLTTSTYGYRCECSVPGCQGCDDVMDARRDARLTG